MSRSLLNEAAKLSVPERLDLVEAIWDTIAADPAALPLSDEHREELDRRLEEFERDPKDGSADLAH